MMKAFLSLIIFIAFASSVTSQDNLNIDQIAHVPNANKLNDVWGYVSDEGTEYAIIGTRNSTEIYSLSDPANPLLVKTILGDFSVWRDMKVLGNFIYVVTDQPGSDDGVTIIDMSNAPEEITFSQVNPVVDGVAIQRCHNLYIDTSLQVMFLAGCDGNSGPSKGVTAFDIATDPKNPQLINVISSAYSHDVFVRDNLVFSSEIFAGQLAIYDIMDIMNPMELGTTPTTSFFTHNAWSSDDNQYVYTTDEVSNGTIDAYDISDLNNPERVDVFEPASIVGQGVVPHNTHFLNDFLITSWYSYGLVITDVSQPNKIVETGHFNTGENPNCWGAYPYLPSGLILASDIDNGFYVLKANYKRAAYLKGIVLDAESGNPIFNATIKVLAEEPFGDNSGPTGSYTTGKLGEGTFMVEFNHPEYEKLILETTLNNGETVELNAKLIKSKIYNQTIKTIDAVSGIPIDSVEILLQKEGLKISRFTDSEGVLESNLVTGDFQVIAGKWGYQYKVVDLVLNEEGIYTIEMDLGYEDDFLFDFGWTTETPNTRSEWVRVIPNGTIYNDQESNPSSDVDGDLGDFCYVTGNGTGGVGANDVDDGNSVLISPIMDLSSAPDAVLKFNPWFFNDGGSGLDPDDTLKVYLRNGIEKELLISISENTGGWGDAMEFKLSNFIALNDQIQISFEAADNVENGHLVEAGVDAFSVDFNGSVVSNDDLFFDSEWSLYPNPVRGRLILSNSDFLGIVDYIIYNSAGEQVNVGQFNSANASIIAPGVPGVYFIQIKSVDGKLENLRFIVAKK